MTHPRNAPSWSTRLLLCLCAGSLLSCSRTEEPPPAPSGLPPNVVLIVMDTVRADHLSCYGYQRPTTPYIDAFAETATRYQRSLSSAPWTVPSHASMFTGKPPFAHGARTYPVSEPRPNVNPLPEDQATLAEVLGSEGYQTAGFVSNVAYLSEHWKLNRGFDTWHMEGVYAEKLNRKVFRWLKQAEPPFFLFVNYIDAHRPYKTVPKPDFLDGPVAQGEEPLNDLLARTLPQKERVPPALVQKVINQYDTALASLDRQVGRLIEQLEKQDPGRETIVVVTSDHGEYFGEHDLVEHSKDVYQPALQVPLIIRGVGQREGRLADTLVVSNDLPRLILAEFPEDLERRLAESFPDVPGEHLVMAENYYSRRRDLFDKRWGHRFQRVRRAVFDWPYKLIRSSDGNHELYQLERDPGELDNRIDQEPEVAARLAAALTDLEAVLPAREVQPDTRPLPEGLRKRLEALGYLDH